MGDKNERIAQLEQRLDDLAVQFEDIVKLLGDSRRTIQNQQRAIDALKRKVSRKA